MMKDDKMNSKTLRKLFGVKVMGALFIAMLLLNRVEAVEEWGGYPVMEGGSVNTESNLGWMNVNRAPWIYSYSLTMWLFVNEPDPEAHGFWAYANNTTPRQETETVAALTFTPDGGAYESEQTVELTTETSGATIRYTLDGSDPDASKGTVYTAPIVITEDTTVKAIAYKSGMLDSAVSTAVYSVNVVEPTVLYPTDPKQIGLSGVGITRADLPVAPSNTFFASDANREITDVQFTDTVWLRPGADNITFKRCWFRGGGDQSIKSSATGNMAVNTSFEDCDFGEDGVSNWVGASHIAFLGGTNYIKRCYFYNSADCIKWAYGSINYIEDSWLQPIQVGDKHTDCFQMDDEVIAKFYALRCTFEKRTFIFDGVKAHSREELSAESVTLANIFQWGNATLQSKPCKPAGSCNGPFEAAYFSWVDCLMTGGGYIATIEQQSGEFIDNVVIRGTGGDTDLGLRDAGNILISGNTFDDGSAYNGLSATGKKSVATPIPDLGL